MRNYNNKRDIKSIVRENKDNEVRKTLQDHIDDLNSEGYKVEFGKIGNRTTYCLIYNEETGYETVGYTFIKNLDYFNPQVGKMKALEQAMARKSSLGL